MIGNDDFLPQYAFRFCVDGTAHLGRIAASFDAVSPQFVCQSILTIETLQVLARD